MDENLAPCVAVVGPANAGKTTLLHQLDERLQLRVPSVLVIKGSPDGTGRYLFRAPQLRNDPAWKAEVKGRWGDATIERICEWIDHGRRNLALALLDFGGKHDPDNPRMLSRCSHYLVVSRASDREGAESWDRVCKESGLEGVGWLKSIGPDNDSPRVLKEEPFEGTFRYDAGPDDEVNDSVIARLAARIAELARPGASTPYIDLKLGQRWTEDMIATVGGRRDAIGELAKRTEAVVLGGRAPVWAYLAGLRCALEVKPGARVFFFDPKQPQRLVEIPPKPGRAPFPEGVMSVGWDKSDDGTDRLRFEARTRDRILPPEASLNLAGAPRFESSPPKSVGLYGPLPIWIHGTYARWLRAAGVQEIAVWDAGMSKFVAVWR